MTSEKVMWHYRREQNGMVNTTTEAELEPLFFTFVISTFATSPSTRVLGLVAAALMTADGKKDKGNSNEGGGR